jgi:hypothetical protein
VRPAARPTLELPATWPGLADAGTLVLPLDPAHWPPPAAPLCVGTLAFAPKHELHVTVVGKALGADLHAALAEGRFGESALRRAFEGQRWRLRRSGWRIHLRKPADREGESAKESVVEPVALPAMARFHAALSRLLGVALPTPPPHVTLYVHGDAEGIGVPDAATLQRYRVGPPWRAD